MAVADALVRAAVFVSLISPELRRVSAQCLPGDA